MKSAEANVRSSIMVDDDMSCWPIVVSARRKAPKARGGRREVESCRLRLTLSRTAAHLGRSYDDLAH